MLFESIDVLKITELTLNDRLEKKNTRKAAIVTASDVEEKQAEINANALEIEKNRFRKKVDTFYQIISVDFLREADARRAKLQGVE
ncbi:hypothetical protein EVAR_78801_1 [Eumeta japonica]|uniref:Uncharacterized protein n=1 Tax=Eumeta variegata TaxID=151549 RepID=A0A4C1T1I8_EUMVA|nr:hypothetical protein EVAR_78801_1 [Eumeta japonica]